MTSIISINFNFHAVKAYKQNLVKNDPVVSEKNMFEFSYINGLGRGQELTLTFNTHIPSWTQLIV